MACSIQRYETKTYNKRIMYFSSPEPLWNGTATGNADADVRRALLERKFIMSRKGPSLNEVRNFFGI